MIAEFASLWEHVSELRQALLRCLIIILCGTALSLFFYQDLFHLLTRPLKQNPSLQHQELRRERVVNTSNTIQTHSLPDAQQNWVVLSSGARRIDSNTIQLPPGAYVEYDHYISKKQLLVLSPLEGMMISFKTSFWVGFLGTSPLWIFILLKFISPALRMHEKKLLYPFLGLSFLSVVLGITFSFFLTIPMANQYLENFNMQIGENVWTLSNYINYTLFLLLANAAAFEMGLILLFLVHCGLISAEQMIGKRRHMIVVAFILGAILTPPDVLTQFMLAIPLIALYEFAIIYARFREKFTRESKVIKGNL